MWYLSYDARISVLYNAIIFLLSCNNIANIVIELAWYKRSFQDDIQCWSCIMPTISEQNWWKHSAGNFRGIPDTLLLKKKHSFLYSLVDYNLGLKENHGDKIFVTIYLVQLFFFSISIFWQTRRAQLVKGNRNDRLLTKQIKHIWIHMIR